MTINSFYQEKLSELVRIVEDALKKFYTHKNTPAGLRASMLYSLLAGGKRIRPILCLLSAQAFGLNDIKHVLPFAVALECIHSYSLIHDDLPAMDNDELRRGKPTNHIQFNEATAILAGDGLLTDAFAFMCQTRVINHSSLLQAIQTVAQKAGSEGMVGGQFLDMEHSNNPSSTFAQLKDIHSRKTAALIEASCISGALLANADSFAIKNMQTYAFSLGMAFQITDDILDIEGDMSLLGKNVGKDIEMEKVTYPLLLGMEPSKKLAKDYIDTALSALESYSNEGIVLLRHIADSILHRKA